MTKRICCICKKEFWVFPSAIKRNRSKCCSVQCANQSISQTMKGRMPKFIPNNKGRKPSKETKKKISEKLKGRKAPNHVLIGTVKKRKESGAALRYRYWIKIAEPMNWLELAKYRWQKWFGKIPISGIIHHKNKNTLDDRIENLSLVLRAAHMNIHRPEIKRGQELYQQKRSEMVAALGVEMSQLLTARDCGCEIDSEHIFECDCGKQICVDCVVVCGQCYHKGCENKDCMIHDEAMGEWFCNTTGYNELKAGKVTSECRDEYYKEYEKAEGLPK